MAVKEDKKIEQLPISPELQALLDARKNEGKQWYAVSIMSGKEEEVKRDLELRIKSFKMEEYIFDILICWTEEAKWVTNRKTHIKEKTDKMVKKNCYPRYIFVKMIMNDDAWFVVRNTPGVTGLVGSSGKGTKPVPCPKKEMDKILKLCGRYVDKTSSDFVVGYNVKIIKGIYTDQVGKILEVDAETNSLIVELNMMGRKTPTRFMFADVQNF